MTEQIAMPEPVKVYFENLIFDEDNPNQMSEEQETGLDNMFKKFGFLEPIIIEPLVTGKKQLIHHGEHRVRRLMKLGNTWAWGIEKQLSEVDHKLLRQGMNKLQGAHDPKKDAAEFQFIQEQGQLGILAVLIAQPEEQLIVEKDLVIVEKDVLMKPVHADSYIHGNLKQLYFIFDNKQYADIMTRLTKVIEHMNVENNTDMFVKLVENYETDFIKET